MPAAQYTFFFHFFLFLFPFFGIFSLQPLNFSLLSKKKKIPHKKIFFWMSQPTEKLFLLLQPRKSLNEGMMKTGSLSKWRIVECDLQSEFQPFFNPEEKGGTEKLVFDCFHVYQFLI